MRLLLDTNIFLEIILEQEKTDDAQILLSKTNEHDFFITDYSLHSIGILLFRRKRQDVFRQFLNDMMLRAGLVVISLSVDEMESVIEVSHKFQLDFDDAYQYAAAEKYRLTIVSFDKDFERTERRRRIPSEII